MLGQIRDLGSGKVPVIFPAPPLADSLTATTRLSPLHVYTSHTRPYTRLSLHGKISRPSCLACRRSPQRFANAGHIKVGPLQTISACLSDDAAGVEGKDAVYKPNQDVTDGQWAFVNENIAQHLVPLAEPIRKNSTGCRVFLLLCHGGTGMMLLLQWSGGKEKGLTTSTTS